MCIEKFDNEMQINELVFSNLSYNQIQVTMVVTFTNLKKFR